MALLVMIVWWLASSWLRQHPGWVAVEQAGWVAGIVSAALGVVSAAAAVMALRASRLTDRPQPRLKKLVQVGRLPPAASWRQDRRLFVDLRTAAKSDTTEVGVRVLAGMGGVGKTQLAAQLVPHLVERRRLHVLVWVTATSQDAIVTRYAEAASVLGLAEAGVSPNDAAIRLLAWLAHTDRRWLIVLDNLDNPADATGWWPPASATGYTVVTSRVHEDVWGSDIRAVTPVGLFHPDEAIAYLRSAVVDPGSREGAAELATDLGYLPIALAQAAAYIRERGLSCASYRQELADRRIRLRELLPDSTALPDEHAARLDATWSLSIEAVDRLVPAGLATPILHLAALLDPHAIPMDLFTSNATLAYLTSAAARSEMVTPNQVRRTLQHLHRYHLIEFDVVAGLIRMHALVQRATRDNIDADRIQGAGNAAADALLQTWPDSERESDTTAALRANVTALHHHTDSLLYTSRIHPVLVHAGISLGGTGLVAAATDYFRSLYQLASDHLDGDHVDTFTLRREAARWLGRAGDAAGAADAYAALLADQLRVLGPDDPLTLVTRNNLAVWRGAAGDATGAATAFSELLADHARLLGDDHSQTLTTRNNLAYQRGQTGDTVGAVQAFAELLADFLRVLGPDHPKTLIARSNLARFQGLSGDVSGAVDGFTRLLPDVRRILGPAHTDTLATREQLAYYQSRAGNPTGATSALAEVLDDRMRILGADHPHTLTNRLHFANCRGATGDPAGAFADLAELLRDQLRVVGPDHPDTLVTRREMACWRERAGETREAVRDLQEVVQDMLRVLGPCHIETASTRRELTRVQARVEDRAGAPDILPETDTHFDDVHAGGAGDD
ncbi:FxSxx-COOH system tetratricopeptide repeat protein [Micromonospora lutea]|uniref:FxSxx-COOH system tetratricopeptide repeat protein n=1 Tax=Micromonospora lutea TaxID=419825 RepID=UPI00194F3729|nr:FxSxx-COOH system tetratricopeptide repeat protein [Micromonospora lutea]